MKPTSALAASAMAVVLLGALAVSGPTAAQTASTPDSATTAQKDMREAPARAAPQTTRKDSAASDRAAKAKTKRQSRLVYGEPSLAMDPDPFLALSSPAVGLVYGIPRRQ